MNARAQYIEGGNEFAHGIIDSDGNFVFVTQYAGCTEEVWLASVEDQNRAIALFLAAPDLLKALESLTAAVNTEGLPDPFIMFACIEKARGAIAKARGEK